MDRRRMAMALAAAIALAFLIVPAFGRRRTAVPDIAASARACQVSPNRPACFARLAADLLAGRPLPRVLASLHAAAADPAVASVCHILGHYLGQAEYRRTGDLGLALGQCDDFCYGSCYHGAAEAFVVERASGVDDGALAAVAALVPRCSEGCREWLDTIHGVGHALMSLTTNDLPRALALCDATAQPVACHVGAFMSNFMSLEDPNHPSAFARSGDPTFPCRILDERYQPACYKNQADFLVTGDIARNVELCRKFPGQFRESCYLEAPKRRVHAGDDLMAVAADCVRIEPASAAGLCIEGIIVNLHGRNRDDARDMAVFCGLVGEEYRPSCYRRMGEVLADWLHTPENRSMACDMILKRDSIDWCME